MNLNDWNVVVQITKDLVTALGVLVGGGWALWKFGIQREAHAKIEFDLELNVLGQQKDSLIVEIVAKVTNKGRVRHWLRNFRFDLLYIPKDIDIEIGDEHINYHVLFQTLFKNKYWIPPNWMDTFIDSGVCQRYTYIASAPAKAKFLLVFAIFKYPDSDSKFHTAQRVWAIEQPTQEARRST